MQEIRPDQAPLIYDLESYCRVIGCKRFKRTKAEKAAGLSPEEALKQRLQAIVPADPNHPWTALSDESMAILQTGLEQAKNREFVPGPSQFSGNFSITIMVTPEVGVDPDYFEHIRTKNLSVRLDAHWYKWYDELLANKFDGDEAALVTKILNQGIGAVLTPYGEQKSVASSDS